MRCLKAPFDPTDLFVLRKLAVKLLFLRRAHFLLLPLVARLVLPKPPQLRLVEQPLATGWRKFLIVLPPFVVHKVWGSVLIDACCLLSPATFSPTSLSPRPPSSLCLLSVYSTQARWLFICRFALIVAAPGFIFLWLMSSLTAINFFSWRPRQIFWRFCSNFG